MTATITARNLLSALDTLAGGGLHIEDIALLSDLYSGDEEASGEGVPLSTELENDYPVRIPAPCGMSLDVVVYGKRGSTITLVDSTNTCINRFLRLDYTDWEALINDVKAKQKNMQCEIGLRYPLSLGIDCRANKGGILPDNGYRIGEDATGVAWWWRYSLCCDCKESEQCIEKVYDFATSRMKSCFRVFDVYHRKVVGFMIKDSPLLFSEDDTVDLWERIRFFALIARLVDARDRYTLRHSYNVSVYSQVIASMLGLKSEKRLEVGLFGMLHDLGKISLPDEVFTNPILTGEMCDKIKEHPIIGAKMLDAVGGISWEERAMVLYHHERYDGGGYPTGLGGDDLPKTVYVVSFADALDAMLSDRVYRKALPWDQVIREVREGCRKQFHPLVAEAFLDGVHSRQWAGFCEGLKRRRR